MQFRNRTTAVGAGRLIAGIAALVLLLTGLSCGRSSDDPVVQTDIPFRADGILDFLGNDGAIVTRIAIEIAESDSAQARGLMNRRSLPARGGMLFIDPEPSERSFWMKNTPMPLDIIFVRADSTIANIAKRTTPFSSDQIKSDGPAQFVVEVRAGFADRYGLGDSLRINWTRSQ